MLPILDSKSTSFSKLEANIYGIHYIINSKQSGHTQLFIFTVA